MPAQLAQLLYNHNRSYNTNNINGSPQDRAHTNYTILSRHAKNDAILARYY